MDNTLEFSDDEVEILTIHGEVIVLKVNGLVSKGRIVMQAATLRRALAQLEADDNQRNNQFFDSLIGG